MTVLRGEPAAVVRDLRAGPIGFEPFGAEEADWQERALCAQTDPESFFPEKGGSTREAKKICTGCEVRSECLEYALEHDERFGIWGGLSERERRRLKKQAVSPGGLRPPCAPRTARSFALPADPEEVDPQ